MPVQCLCWRVEKEFALSVTPFLRKDVAARIDAAEQTGVDLGRLLAVIEAGPMDLM
jgi:hypothetical protein